MVGDSLRQNVTSRSKAVYEQINNLSGDSLLILGQTIKRFNEVNAWEAAAAMAYYALFSLFPLLLVIVSVGSVVLESQQVQQQLFQLMADFLPGRQTRQFITENIQRILELRGPVGIVGLVGLLWAATGVFNTLAYHINRAWHAAEIRGFIARRLIALGFVGGLFGLLILSVISTAVINILARAQIFLDGTVLFGETSFVEFLSRLISVVIRLAVFLGLYRWVPNTKVSWLEALWGAVVAVFGWELTTSAFTWYLGSRFAQYEVVYGSLGTIIALLFWIYIGSIITLFGAYLSATIAMHQRQKKAQ